MLDTSRTQVMGILNITPDSFSDGGELFSDGAPDLDVILAQAEQMLHDGADILDVGGESTRPGAEVISSQEEMDRVLPVIEALRTRLDAVVSIDTSTPDVMAEAINQGVAMINDVRALTKPGALDVVAQADMPVCLMHMQGQPGVMQQSPCYDNVVDDVMAFLKQRIQIAVESGISKARIVIDPGFGFGKTLAHNVSLFNALPAFVATGFPVLVGVSRKSMIGDILGKPVDQRIYGSTALALLAIKAGAKLVRVHDVAATVDTLKIYSALNT